MKERESYELLGFTLKETYLVTPLISGTSPGLRILTKI
jgi:hypothetical protein